MRDDDPAFIDLMQRELHTVRWPEPAELRARARRRSRRTVAAAAAAVLALTSGAAFVAADRGTPPVPAAASPSATAWRATDVPADALLQPSDLRPAVTTPWSEAYLGEEIRLDRMLEVCRQDQGLGTGWTRSRYSRSVSLVRERRGTGGQPEGQVLASQDLHRLAPEDGERLFDGLPALLAPCRTWRATGPVEWRNRTVQAEVVHSWQEVDRGFAGDESVILRHTVERARRLDTGAPIGDPSGPREQAVVRVGDLVTVLSTRVDGSEAELRELARVAVRRMCVAAHPGC
ncbi:hypothetical protein GA0070622_5890 [Micromonospora sediminicola]|uniref:Uncharacterized protein n=1 Tax=Micromonospora sediminicola TaxID=946078 RepID=A0A1A9BIJ4_9ACTN|nr:MULTISPECIES: hypothetical protein [Micromonospora]PGH43474.1 hypothetical protein COO58_02745 [Micromonospora sp. WMMA1996]SBT68779.1 hypothetical protein GA0070622_5890 [Micromonospora sediminicola]